MSYVPQCMGSEDRLRDCTTVDQDDSCDVPVVISCLNSSEITTVTPVTLLTSTSSLVSSALIPTSTLSNNPPL